MAQQFPLKMNKRKASLETIQKRAGIVMALPAIIGFLLFFAGPIIASGVLSFFNWNFISQPVYSGLENYKNLFMNDPVYWQSFYKTLQYVVTSVPVTIVVQIILAVLLNQNIKGRGIFRTIFYLPVIIPALATGYMFNYLFSEQRGAVNWLLSLLKITPLPWLTNTHMVPLTMVLVTAWLAGGGIVILLASLQGIPNMLYESADIDGASNRQKFFVITLPMISPAIFFNLITGCIGAIQIFPLAVALAGSNVGIGNSSGPGNALYMYIWRMYDVGFQYFHAGEAAAMGWILFLLSAFVTWILFITAKRWVYSGENE